MTTIRVNTNLDAEPMIRYYYKSEKNHCLEIQRGKTNKNA